MPAVYLPVNLLLLSLTDKVILDTKNTILIKTGENNNKNKCFRKQGGWVSVRARETSGVGSFLRGQKNCPRYDE